MHPSNDLVRGPADELEPRAAPQGLGRIRGHEPHGLLHQGLQPPQRRGRGAPGDRMDGWVFVRKYASDTAADERFGAHPTNPNLGPFTLTARLSWLHAGASRPWPPLAAPAASRIHLAAAARRPRRGGRRRRRRRWLLLRLREAPPMLVKPPRDRHHQRAAIVFGWASVSVDVDVDRIFDGFGWASCRLGAGSINPLKQSRTAGEGGGPYSTTRPRRRAPDATGFRWTRCRILSH